MNLVLRETTVITLAKGSITELAYVRIPYNAWIAMPLFALSREAIVEMRAALLTLAKSFEGYVIVTSMIVSQIYGDQ